MKKTTRGGPRKGAGRPKKGSVPLFRRVPPEILDQCNQAINQIIEQNLKSKTMKTIILSLLICSALYSCKKDEESSKPSAHLTDTSLIVTASVDGIQIDSGSTVGHMKQVKFRISMSGTDDNRPRRLSMGSSISSTKLINNKSIGIIYAVDTPSFAFAGSGEVIFTTTLTRDKDTLTNKFRLIFQ